MESKKKKKDVSGKKQMEVDVITNLDRFVVVKPRKSYYIMQIEEKINIFSGQ